MVTLVLNLKPFLPAIGTFLFGIGGMLRIAYALLFEPGVGGRQSLIGQPTLIPNENRGELPGSQLVPASVYSAHGESWRDTNDLQRTPGSVTDSTTKLLQKDDPDQ